MEELQQAIRIQYVRVRRQFGYLVVDPATADDLAQEVFVRLWQAFQKPLEIDNLRSFMSGISRRVFLEYMRQTRKVPTETIELATVEDPNAGRANEAVEKAEASQTLNELLACLSAEERQLVVARYVLNMTGHELSDLTGEPRTTVLYRLGRAVEKLRRLASRRKLEL